LDTTAELLESLILAQDKRWRRALNMQVERGSFSDGSSGGRLSKTWLTCPTEGDTAGKLALKPHTVSGDSDQIGKALRSCSWRGPRPIR